MRDDEFRHLVEVEDRMWHFRALHGVVHQYLERGIRGMKSVELLDAGCGTGGFLRRMGQWHPDWRLRGVDLSETACGLAARRVQAEVVQGDVTRLPFAAESFEAITSVDVVSQIDAPEAALAEYWRCLRPGGVVVLNVPAYRWMRSYHDRLVDCRRRYRRRELETLLQAAGFEPLASTYWNSALFPLVVVRRKLLGWWQGSSDVHPFPAWLETAFGWATALELAWLRRTGYLPFGNSVLALARKPAKLN